MSEGIINKFLSLARRIFFEDISTKFKVSSFKNMMDLAYVIFEKTILVFDIFTDNYLKMYVDIVEKEIRMANISSEDTVLVIGCGSIPATSILIAQKTMVKVVSIDKDAKAISNASRFIKKYNFKDLMIFDYADGVNYSIKKFDTIFLLYGIKQQKDILKYISKYMKEDARIILRTTQETLDKKIGGVSFLKELFTIKKQVSAEKIYLTESYLLLKK